MKAMIFADVKDFSKLVEHQLPHFFQLFIRELMQVMRKSHHGPVFFNTWGDGLFLVFDTVVDCADFAVRLLRRMERINWAKIGLPPSTAMRMGIHAGPVFPQRDAILKRRNFFGSHVNRAARIEPVTTPGCAFTSEQFAALLAVEAGDRFVCEYVGIEDLAKKYARCPLYRLGRK